MKLIIEIIRRIKRLLKRHHLLPIYPIDILMEIKNNHSDARSLCHGITLAERKFNISQTTPIITIHHIKKFNRDIAIHNFGGEKKWY